MGLLNTLTSNELLSKPKSVSSHLAICIGKILNRHIDDQEFCASIDSFYQNKVKQATSEPELYVGHLKTILTKCDRKKLGTLENAQWPVECINAVALATTPP